ncbi:MAG: hypothetical protein ACXWF8_17035 [Methylobacter sp.]
MKLISAVVVVGFVLLYFVDSAFKFNTFEPEMLIHSAIRYFAGFFVLGIGVFYAHKIKLKYALALIFILSMADDIYDYTRNVNSFHFEVMLHGLYMLSWGALTGYVSMKQWLDGKSQ